ncbi:hypothetical protein [Sporosarcina jiandibaonis]|uniref:hypothetical protein n=1 Tax=Sporosarcina jiandibaonis TaxID=2715535 RepID=UPI001C12F151|nr:hypothetical protein [Sporosarcina jiandibaonis]
MKFIKGLITLLLLIGGTAYGIYYFGTNKISENVADSVYNELENTGQLDEIRQVINNDPDIKQFIAEGNVDTSNLPYQTKEQATRAIIQKVGIGELQNMQSKYQNGISSHDIDDILSSLEGKFTQEEILALKVIAYEELNK